MVDKSLRGFLKGLEKAGELVRVSEKVKSDEVFGIQWKLYREGGPAAILENVQGHKMPVVVNVFGTLDRFAMMCGFGRGKTPREVRNLYAEKIANKSAWLKPKLVSSGPCKEVVLKGKDAVFSRLPVFKWHPGDGGPYITLPASIVKDDKFGTNVGIYRMMLHDDKTSGIMCSMFQHQGIFLSRAAKAGKDKIDCAVALGAPPALYLAAVTSLDVGDNELELTGALHGEPLRVCKAETCDLEVPADAEIILEGEISTRERKAEAPFAEWMGYHEDPMMLPVFKLKCITMRKDAMYHMTTADNEGEVIRQTPLQAKFYLSAKQRVTGFADCWLPESGRGYTAVVAIRKYYPGWGQQAIYQTMGVPFSGAETNVVMIVDADIDTSNLEQIMWAMSTRVDPHYDVVITKPQAAFPLNPAARVSLGVDKATGSTEYLMVSRMGIDATAKLPQERVGRAAPRVTKPPEDVFKALEKRWAKLGLGGKK